MQVCIIGTCLSLEQLLQCVGVVAAAVLCWCNCKLLLSGVCLSLLLILPHLLPLLQFGAGLSPDDLKTSKGYTLNLASYAARQALLHLSDALPFPIQKVRAKHGLPRAAGRCPPSNVLARVRGVRSQKCEALLEVTLGNWLIEYAQPQAANQVRRTHI
jgi:hypothetical protein